MQVKIKKLHPEAIIPTYATEGAACFDLHAVSMFSQIHVQDGKPFAISTGLAFEIPKGYVMLIYSRSGHGFIFDTRLANCVGVIDSDYRGEVMVKLTRDISTQTYLKISKGDRIAQAMIVPVPQVAFTEVGDLTTTERGAGGFGSTGA